ncbi:S8 family peptidase [Streptomyces synnematoformans]|uniref:S8 family serine peptidase n=1 Tax=Streptomyces synnematoformans TaxID=415721 RepID=A0ABP5JCU2_9ACTN
MRRHFKKAGLTVLSAAAATALAAGLTVAPPASAAPASGAAGATAGNGDNGGKNGPAQYGKRSGTWVTLITGDRVRVGADGGAVAIDRGPGRDGIPVRTFESEGHTYVVPRDATALVGDGTLDRRLFDVTLQARPEYVRQQRAGLKLIVDYRGERPEARERLRAADGTEVEHRFPRLGAEAVTTAKGEAAAAWKALTRAEGGNGAAEPLAAEAGVRRVWLDGVRRASLDVSVPQIGAPAAWEAGYDGDGVTIAVLDTGVDETHPDLADQVVATENFTPSPDAEDRYGHGTHVASIAAGTGAKSNGKLTGVAPGAQLLAGKVLGDDGFGDDSGILAGFEWAVDQGADIVNLSLGGGDTPEVDPLEEAVNRISAEEGVLFAIAAGNAGELGSHTVDSPGSADAALTVGAVGPGGGLAGFSSRGPRIGDGAVKPDVTAPGVSITAAAAPGSLIEQEVGQNPEGYLSIDGTSMATPHVAGAAALLKQQHPDWTGAELKAALSASAKPAAKRGAYGQGAGLVAADQALGQSVVTEPASLSFGRPEWPHGDDEPVTKQLTYRNLGTEDVTLSLATSTVQPGGGAAPEGMFTLGADEVTVPAGGTAEVPVTADTRVGGADGVFSVYVTATGGGQRVVTPGGVEREEESYDVTVEFLGRDGEPTAEGVALLAGMEESNWDVFQFLGDESGTATVRVPKGRYLISADIAKFAGEELTEYDWINQPRLDVTGDTTVTVDARTTGPVDVTVPDADARRTTVDMHMDVDTGDVGASLGSFVDGAADVRTAHLGPATADGELYQQVQVGFNADARTDYQTVYSHAYRTTMWNGLVRATPQSELARLDVTLGTSAADRQGMLFATPWIRGGTGASATARDLPYRGELYVRGGGRINWELEFWQLGEEWEDIAYIAPERTYAGGGTYSRSFNAAVVGPILTEGLGATRDGNTIDTLIPVYLDHPKHFGYSAYENADTSLYRNGEKLGSVADLPIGTAFNVPSGDARYKLTTSSTRPATVARTSTKVTATWIFSSARTDGPRALPISVVRFSPRLSPSSSSNAGLTKKVPVKVLGSAAGSNLKSLTVWASTDRGGTWEKLPVRDGSVTVVNPAAGKTVSFKAKAEDKQGNKVSMRIFDAYRTR